MGFKVRVEPSDQQFTVEAGESILDAALRQGHTFAYSCRSGTCGTCKGKVVEGEIDYGQAVPKALGEKEAVAGMALFCIAQPQTDLSIEVREIDGAEEVQIRRLPCRVARKELLASDVLRLYLKLPADQRLQYLAGQYVDFILKDGRRRSFSLANPPHDDALLELHVRQVPGGEFTGFLFNQMQEKAMLRLEGPFGNFYLREDSPRPMIFISGGTGFAPIKAIIEHAFAMGVDRPMHLYWGARATQDLYLDKLPREWQSRSGFQYIPVLSEPRPEDGWQGRTGFVHTAVLADHPDLTDYDVYASGPPPMVEAARAGCLEHGLPMERFYFDSFDFAADTQASLADSD